MMARTYVALASVLVAALVLVLAATQAPLHAVNAAEDGAAARNNVRGDAPGGNHRVLFGSRRVLRGRRHVSTESPTDAQPSGGPYNAYAPETSSPTTPAKKTHGHKTKSPVVRKTKSPTEVKTKAPTAPKTRKPTSTPKTGPHPPTAAPQAGGGGNNPYNPYNPYGPPLTEDHVGVVAAHGKTPTSRPTAAPITTTEYEYEPTKLGGPGDNCITDKSISKCRRGLMCSSKTGECVNPQSCETICTYRSPKQCETLPIPPQTPGCGCFLIGTKCWMAT